MNMWIRFVECTFAGMSYKYGSILMILGLIGCASVMPPGGGEKDIIPPRLIREKSTRNEQTLFRPEEIILTFDEWIRLQDPQKQIVVSPPVAIRPEVEVKGKKLTLRFDPNESWRDNTTYSIFFGEAVRDLTEANIAPELKFMFSTGPILDSLSLSGLVLDAVTLQPAQDILVMLHTTTSDSSIVLELPVSFARTNKVGRYSLSNLKAGTYRLFGLADRNSNYRFDLPNERLGWAETTIEVTAESIIPPVIYLQPERKVSRVSGIDSLKTPGSKQIKFTAPPEYISIDPTSMDSVFLQWIHDTVIIVWPSPGCSTGWVAFGQDTVRYSGHGIVPPPDQKFNLKQAHAKPQPPHIPFALFVTPPLKSYESNQIIVSYDSISLVPDCNSNLRGDTLWLSLPVLENKLIQCTFLPGSLTALSGLMLRDTISLTYVTNAQQDWATLSIDMVFRDSSEQILMEILNEQGTRILGPYAYTGWMHTANLPPLPAGSYKALFVRDDDRNGRWDAGHFLSGKNAEPRIIFELPLLRANWDQKVTLKPEWHGTIPDKK